MNEAFPFGFPGPTALYLSLYVVTLALHVLFMNYALAGTLYVSIAALLGRTPLLPDNMSESGASSERDSNDNGVKQLSDNAGDTIVREATLSSAIVEGLPFSLGLAITAGVAPLLFVQILYEQRFYTANLLLHHRWMLIVPALIAGFYLLYLLKTKTAKARPWLWRLAALGAAGCFVFVAWSWTENHLLSRDDHAWVTTYAKDRLIYSSIETWPRLLMWLLGAFATLAVLVGFQLQTAKARGELVSEQQIKRLARIGLGGVLLGGAAALGYAAVASQNAANTGAASAMASMGLRGIVLSPLALPYLLVTLVGGLMQLGAWGMVLRRGQLAPGALRMAAAGLTLALLGSGAVRESVRLSAIDIAALYPNHARAAQAQGLWLFLAFLVINGLLITFAFRVARRAALEPETS